MPCGADSRNHDASIFEFFVDNFERVIQCSLGDDRGTVLIVMKYGNIQFFPQPGFNFKAPWGRNIFEVNPAIDRGDRLDDLNKLFGIGSVQSYWPGIHVGELLE